MREAPSITISEMLAAEGAHVRGYDPVAMEVAATVMNITLCRNAYEVAEGCDAIVVVTDWNEFKQLDMLRIKESMRQPVLIDGRNIYDPDEMKEKGFIYRGFGRGYNDRRLNRE